MLPPSDPHRMDPARCVAATPPTGQPSRPTETSPDPHTAVVTRSGTPPRMAKLKFLSDRPVFVVPIARSRRVPSCSCLTAKRVSPCQASPQPVGGTSQGPVRADRGLGGAARRRSRPGTWPARGRILGVANDQQQPL